ncbi:unnamed protein product [Prorocentrum cordatum]|uniref:Uncharacterized protein n=1 Tax=Prorocentrum cordatum TaxID=2364126 RepID=A0ABN9TE81_9DINO|nr:unnamed protein product [Polarella glacialis]
MWAGNVYEDRETGGILMFIHMEFHDPRPAAEMCYFRFGLAYSDGGGESFKWLGYLAEPELSYEHSMFGSKYGRPRWFPNMGLPSYVVKGGHFYVYYGDSHDLDADGRVQRTAAGGGGNPDQGVAVVRASVAEVMVAARRGEAAQWLKYFNGSFSEPAMGGGRFTPLDLSPQGYMHGDAAWCEPLGQWVMVQQSGGRIREVGAWRKSILLSFSSDALHWTEWQPIYTVDSGEVVYPSLMSLDGPNNEVLGRTFSVVFQHRAGDSAAPPFQFDAVNVTVSLSAASRPEARAVVV